MQASPAVPSKYLAVGLNHMIGNAGDSAVRGQSNGKGITAVNG